MKRDPLKQFTLLRDSLSKRKAELETELAKINAALGVASAAAMTSRSPKATLAKTERKTRRPRAKNSVSLRDAVLAAIKAKPLTKPEILIAVKKQGYVFAAKSPMNSLNTLLYTDKGFKNLGGKFGPA